MALIKEGKLFGLLNLLDLIIIIAAIFAAILIFKYISGNAVKGTRQTIHFTVELNDVTDAFVDKIQPGDEIKDSIKGYYLGTVSRVTKKPFTLVNWDSNDNIYIKSDVPDKNTVLVEIKANGLIDGDKSIHAGEVPVRVGKEMSIKGKGYARTGYVVDLQEE